MRLWHKALIPYLPKQQLLGQWRELNSIFKLQNRHVLINFVYDDYSSDHLLAYSDMVILEMEKREVKFNITNYHYFFFNSDYECLENEDVYANKMNDRYLRQCLYNLQEKYDCGGISESEWRLIYKNFKQYIEE